MKNNLDRHSLALLVLGVAISAAAVLAITEPGYMDAEYYFVTGRQLSLGEGFREPFIWNYLNMPSDVVHPSHGYWQPLTSLVAAASMSIFGAWFRPAQLPFIVLTALLPLLTASFSYSLHQDRRAAFLSGLLAAVPGYFLPYFLTTDMFILYAWIGTLFFWSLHVGWRSQGSLIWMASGECIGLAHLGRADGLLFAVPLIYFLSFDRKRILKRVSLAFAGYVLVMAPWFLRNLDVYGAILPPGSGYAIWLRSYEDLFRYPPTDLGPRYLLDGGWELILSTRITALWTNIQRVIAENGYVFLLPLMLLGLVDQWRLRVVRSVVAYWAVLLLIMSFVFPFAGAQGGTFHSSAALMPSLWMLVPFGLRRAVVWAGARRGWNVANATINFGWISVVLAALFTAGTYLQRVYGFEQIAKSWGADQRAYEQLGQELRDLDPDTNIVMVNNPPGFYNATGIPAVVVPSGGIDSLRAALADFDVDYLILDRNHPIGLGSLYSLEQVPEWLEQVHELEAGRSGHVLILRTLPALEPE